MPDHSPYAVQRHFEIPFDEDLLEEWAVDARRKLAGPPTFALVFISPLLGDRAREILEIVRIYTRVSTVVGCSGTGLIGSETEYEDAPGIMVGIFHLPGSESRTVRLDRSIFPADAGDCEALIQRAIGPNPEDTNGWLLFADPLELGGEQWLSAWDKATGRRPTIGGLASSDPRDPQTWLLADGEVFNDGAVALGISGATAFEPLLSQGCRPIGTPWVITKAEDNMIHQIGNRPILEVLRDTLEGIPEKDKQLARGNVFVGIVHNEYKERFKTGDFLVRNLAAIDPRSGAVAIASEARTGQNLQFQIRDISTSTASLQVALERTASRVGGRQIFGACCCNCIGRGSGFYGAPDHDARLVQQRFPGLPVAGAFVNGELAPNIDLQNPGRQSGTFLHGYSNAMAFFVGA